MPTNNVNIDCPAVVSAPTNLLRAGVFQGSALASASNVGEFALTKDATDTGVSRAQFFGAGNVAVGGDGWLYVEVRIVTSQDHTAFLAGKVQYSRERIGYVKNGAGAIVIPHQYLDVAVSSAVPGTSGFVLAPTQSFNNIGQTTPIPAVAGVAGSAAGYGNMAPIDADFAIGTALYWRQSVTATGLDSTGWTSFVLTLKAHADDGDDAALATVLVSNPAGAGDGLIRLNGSVPGDRTLAAIAVGAITPDTTVTWTLQAAATDFATSDNGYFAWELDRWTGGKKERIGSGNLTVSRSVRRGTDVPA